MKAHLAKAIGWFCYRASRAITWFLGATLWRMKVLGAENIPTTGPFLMCPVHRSNIDGPLTCTFTRRRMRYLSKEEMFKIAWLGNLFRAMGAIPVNRGTPDRTSLHLCMQAIAAGYPLVLFPEGGRRDGPVVETVMDGAAYLAIKANVPIVPIGIAGAEEAQPRGSKLIRPSRIRVHIGEPFSLPVPDSGRASRSVIHESTMLIRQKLQENMDKAMAMTGEER